MNHFYHAIPGWFDWEDFYREMVERAPSDQASWFVELGAFYGKSAAFMGVEIANSRKPIRFTTYDSWQGVPPNYGAPGKVKKLEETCRQNLIGVPAVVIGTDDAISAAARWPDGEVDFVFIDDDHSAAHVVAVCHAWWPKVRSGGVLAGHDLDWPSVRDGVLFWAGHESLTIDPNGTLIAAQPIHVEPVSQRCWKAVKP